jgi:hypothetical protein
LDFIQVTGPEGKVIAKQLHDCGRVTVLVFFETIEVGNCVVEGFLCDLASNLWAIQDFVVKDRVVQSQTQSNWMSGLQVFCRLSRR